MNNAIPRWDDFRKRWQLNKSVDGVRRTFYSSKPGKAGSIECKRKAADYAESGDKSMRRLNKAWPDYLKDVKHRGGTDNYSQREMHGRLYLLPALGRKKVRDITDQDWQDVINAAAEFGHEGKPLSKKSLLNLRGTISDFYHFARKSRMMTVMPDLYIPKSAVINNKDILQPAQFNKLFSSDAWIFRGKIRHEYYINAWRLMAVTGLRPGECYGLKQSDVQDDVLVIQRSINSRGEVTKGKNANARRTIVLHALAKKIIAEQMSTIDSKASGWLFTGRDGEKPVPQTIYKAWRSYASRAGISCTPYELRHTFVSMLKNDMPSELMKRLVGHSEAMDTFGVYGHQVDGELQTAAKILDEKYRALI